MGLSEIYKGIGEVFRKTSIEVVLMAALGLGSGIYFGIKHENKRDREIPLCFSEIGQIIKDSEKNGERLSGLNYYLPAVNDLGMKIFESYNESTNYNSVRRGFAEELKKNLSSKEYHFNLNDLLDSVPKLANVVQNDIGTHYKVKEKIKSIHTHMDNSWTERHIDNYHAEVYTYSCGEKGDQTCTGTRQVYDDTDHYFYYNSKEGLAGVVEGRSLIEKYPAIKLNGQLKTSSQTNEKGEIAANKSRKKEEGELLKKEELQKIANTWYDGATILINQKEIEKLYNQFKRETSDWGESTKTAKKEYHYNTTSSHHSGPKEFQSAEAMTNTSYKMYKNLEEVTNSIDNTIKDVPELKKDIKEYINTALYNEKNLSPRKRRKTEKKLSKKIIQGTKDMYYSNFKKGEDVDRFRNWLVILFALGGATAGSLMGAGLDKLSQRDNYNTYY